MTELEARVLDLVVEWRDSKYAVAEALVRQELIHPSAVYGFKFAKFKREIKMSEKLFKASAKNHMKWISDGALDAEFYVIAPLRLISCPPY